MTDSLYRIVAPHFVCGVIAIGGSITKTAPITAYMRGWTVERMQSYVKQKRWQVAEVKA